MAFENGNLPAYYESADRAEFRMQKITFGTPPKFVGARLAGVHPGDHFVAHIIDARLQVSSGVPDTITARVIGDRLRGAVFTGTATFDPSIKGRVLLDFTQLRLPNSEQAYELSGIGRRLSGELGLEGELRTNALAYAGLAGLTAAIAGYADASVDRDKSVLGGTIPQNTVVNNMKQGATAGALELSKLSTDQVRNAAEYIDVDGDQDIAIVIKNSPTEK